MNARFNHTDPSHAAQSSHKVFIHILSIILTVRVLKLEYHLITF